MVKNVLSALIIVLITASIGWTIDETIIFEPTIVSSTTIEVAVKINNQDNLIAINFALEYSDGLKFKSAHFKNSRVEYFDLNTAKKIPGKNVIIYGSIWQLSPKPVAPLSAGTGLITTLIFEIIDPTIEIYFEDIKTACPDPVHLATFVYRNIVNGEFIQSVVYPKVDIKPTSYITSINDTENLLPKQFELLQNYPNPFNPITTIVFTLPVTTHVKLTIFNICGQSVKTLVSAQLPAGTHKINWNANTISSGVYFYKITAENFSASKKMMVLK